MIPRRALKTVQQALGRQAAVALLGPRQVGKTTLALAVARETASLYLDLEAPDDRAKLTDPALFLRPFQDRLVILDEIGRYETVLIQNELREHEELADRVVRRLEGVVIARSYSLLEYNIPRAKLAAAEEITPGFHSPTVSSLEDADWCAVRVMVKRSQVIGVMEKLEAIGATAILETEINNCRL